MSEASMAWEIMAAILDAGCQPTEYGQSLSGPRTMTFNLGNLEPRLFLSERTYWIGDTIILPGH